MKTLKKIKSFHNKHIYIYNIGAIDILKFYENLFKTTLPTIGNEKRKSNVTPLFSGKTGFINIIFTGKN